MYWPEKYQLGIVKEYLHEKGVDYTTEATLYSIPVDILGFDGNDTYAIELKTQDFGRGIRQAQRNTSFTDYSYMAVWEENISEKLLDRMEELDIGLLSVGVGVKCLSSPIQNQPNNHAREIVIERVSDNVRKQYSFSTPGAEVGD
jgi:hypothetical protein